MKQIKILTSMGISVFIAIAIIVIIEVGLP
jgi:hypothetical protein